MRHKPARTLHVRGSPTSLGSLRGTRVISEPVDDSGHRSGWPCQAARTLAAPRRGTRPVGHEVRIKVAGRSQVGFGLNVVPGDKRFACLDARAGFTRRSSVGKVLQQFGEVIRRRAATSSMAAIPGGTMAAISSPCSVMRITWPRAASCADAATAGAVSTARSLMACDPPAKGRPTAVVLHPSMTRVKPVIHFGFSTSARAATNPGKTELFGSASPADPKGGHVEATGSWRDGCSAGSR